MVVTLRGIAWTLAAGAFVAGFYSFVCWIAVAPLWLVGMFFHQLYLRDQLREARNNEWWTRLRAKNADRYSAKRFFNDN